MSEHRIIVTDDNFGDLLVQSAQDALDYVRGDRTKGRVRVRTQAPQAILPPPAPYKPEQVRALRIRLGLKQHDFAHALNVSDKTVKAWEQGVNPPSGTALRLLQVIERHPEIIEGDAAD